METVLAVLKNWILVAIVFLASPSAFSAKASDEDGTLPPPPTAIDPLMSYSEQRRLAKLLPSEQISPCRSSQEFATALKYFKESDLPLSLSEKLKWSLRLSEGCDGATSRFSRLFKYMTHAGFDIGFSLLSSGELALFPPSVTDSFLVLFPGLIAADLLSLDYRTAFRLARDWSLIPSVRAEKLQSDFLQLLRFCTENKSTQLPIGVCADLVTQVAPLSPLYVEGLFPAFRELIDFFQAQKLLKLSLGQSLPWVREILKGGPFAKDEFKETLRLLIQEEKVALPAKDLLQIALKVSHQSFVPSAEELSRLLKDLKFSDARSSLSAETSASKGSADETAR